MKFHHLWPMFVFFSCMTNVVGAQDLTEKAALQNKDFITWVGADGDINGDGLNDSAAVEVHYPNDENQGVRLEWHLLKTKERATLSTTA